MHPLLQTSSSSVNNTEKQFLNLLYQPYKILFFLPFFFLSTIVLGSLVVVLATIGWPGLARKVPVFWARLNAFLLMSKVRVEGFSNIDPKQSYIVVANHQSHYDILALYGFLDMDFRWVMKQELRKIPFLGLAGVKLGHVFVDRSNIRRANQSIAQVKDQITNGTSILFFPEGTRSAGIDMLPFKRGAFKMATDLELPILPITINGSGRILPSKTLNILPGSVELIIHPPIPLDGRTDKELSPVAREVIESSLR